MINNTQQDQTSRCPSIRTPSLCDIRQQKILELEQRVKVPTEALTRIRDEDIGPAKCVSIAYKALAPLPKESNSPETELDEALRRQ